MLDEKIVEEKLKELGNSLLKKPYKEGWREDNPTYGYCYIVSEAFYHYSGIENLHAYCINLGDEGVHWFLKHSDEILDYTKKQFKREIDYGKAVRKGFFKGGVATKRGYISKRGYQMAKHLGLLHKEEKGN